MIVRSWATFTSDLPDDFIEDDDDIVQYGGKSVAEAIGEILTRLGCVVEPVIYLDFKGWELDITYKKRRLVCRVAIIDSFLIVLRDRSFIYELLGRYHSAYLDILNRLAEELGRDPRFHDVLWFHSDEVLTDVPGSRVPYWPTDAR